jgi:hypothetical protein
VAWIEHPGYICPGDEFTVDVADYVDYMSLINA